MNKNIIVRKQVKEKLMVSIIVPVYNVEDYIDNCIESIISQTFSDIEILLIVGQSSDQSTYKCREWCLKDKRIRIIDEKQRGLGPARNQGILEAKGEYIAFVDSDDVIRPTYVEKMYNKIVSNNADLVECDYCKIRIYGEKKEYVPCTEILKKEMDISQKLLLGSVMMWKLMTKKELWLDNNIIQPFAAVEDFSTYPILLFAAKKIVNVPEDLYVYQKYSTRIRDYSYATAKMTSQIANAMMFILQECIKRHYFETYKDILEKYILRWISRYCSPCINTLNDEEYFEMKQTFVDVYGRYFDSSKLFNEIILGGFNTSRIINKLPVIEDPYCRFNFVSIISIMSGRTKRYEITHENKYREFMLKREINNTFFDLIKKQKPEYFFFDLLEERHDILEVDGMFFTKSDAFDKAKLNLGKNVRVIKRESNECQKIWKKSCILFFEKLFAYIDPQNIIMIKIYLTEQYGDGENKYYFDNLNEIRKFNDILKEYYQFIEESFQGIQIVKVNQNDKYYYTDINYEFGCYPWNLNEWENIEIAQKISL